MEQYLRFMVPFLFAKDDDAGSGEKKKKPAKKTGSDDSDDKGGDDDDNGDDDAGKKKTPTQVLEDENNRLKREASERDKKDREAEQDRLKKAGEHEERADGLETRNKELEEQLETLKTGGLITTIATREGMEFPEDAAAMLTDDEKKDDRSIEAGLRRLLQDRPKLFTKKKRSGGNIDNDNENEEEERERQNSGDVAPGLGRLRAVKRKT